MLEERLGLRIGNVFHAGDGNLHPLIGDDERVPGQGELAEKVASEILHSIASRLADSLPGEHGRRRQIGLSREDVYWEADLETMQMLRCAFDPTEDFLQSGQGISDAAAAAARCPGLYRQHPAERAGLAERM